MTPDPAPYRELTGDGTATRVTNLEATYVR